MRPKMIVVAGPPGSGKSTAFPVKDFGIDFFNADDRAAALNGGSYQGISIAIRNRVGKEFEDFVIDHINARQEFAIETTLRTDVTFIQAELAKKAGFEVTMLYVCGGDFQNCLTRVRNRALGGGHSAPAEQLSRIYSNSLKNLPRAIREIEEIRIYDTSSFGVIPQLVLEATAGEIRSTNKPMPGWLALLLSETFPTQFDPPMR